MKNKSGWENVKFGDVVRQVKDIADARSSGLDRYIAGEHMDTDDLRIRCWGEINDDYLGPAFHMRFKPGQVLYGSRRTYLRKVAVADFEGICANTTFVLESKDPKILLPELLPFIMQTEAFHEFSIKNSKGSVNPYINFSDLAQYEFALPPLEEQCRMADVLWAIEELNNSYNETRICIENVISSHLQAFLSNYESGNYVRQVAELLREDPRNGYSPRTNESNQGLRTISISAISEGQVITEGNIKYADVDKDRVSPFFVQENDVFVVRGNGNRYLTGKCGIAQRTYSDLFYPDLLIRLRFDDSQIHPRFATLQWNAPIIHRSLITRAKSTNGIWKINGTDIRQHMLVVPPLIEQMTLLTEIDSIKAASENLKRQLSNLAEIKDHLLNHHI